MAHGSSTSSIIERALDETIGLLSREEGSPRVRAILIEARRLRSMVASWKAIPPPHPARKELYANAMQLFAKAGVKAPSVPPPAAASGAIESIGRLDSPMPRPRTLPAQFSTIPPPHSSRRAPVAPGIDLYRPRAMEWRAMPGMKGISVKVLHRDPDTGTFRALLRMEPESVLPSHKHASVEEIMILEGSIEVAGVEAATGDFCHSEPGSVHQPIESRGGCTFFLVGSERDEIVEV